MLKQDIELMQRALGICEVLENGELRLGGRFSDNELMRVYQLLSTDLLSLNIPHYKVVGIVFPRFESKSNSIIKQNDTFSDTFIELNNKFNLYFNLRLCFNIVLILVKILITKKVGIMQ